MTALIIFGRIYELLIKLYLVEIPRKETVRENELIALAFNK